MNRLTLLQKLGRFHWLSLVLMIGMAVASYYFIRSATFTSENPDLLGAPRQQLIYMAAGLVIFFVLSLTNYEILVRMAPVIFIGSILVLLVVHFAGKEVNGARSWLPLGPVSIQPAEFAKLAYIIGMAWIMLQLQEHIKRFWVIPVILVAMAVPVGLIAIQPDFGSAAVFLPITFMMMIVGGISWRYLAIPVLGAVAGMFFAYYVVFQAEWNGTVQDIPRGVKDGIVMAIPGMHPQQDEAEPEVKKTPVVNQGQAASLENLERKKTTILKQYQLDRIRTFFNPDLDPRGAGWTIRQSLIAAGSGGLKGKGYLKGDQNLYGFLPKNIAYNDFIFSVIAEEWGFIGGSILIVAHGILILCIVSVAGRSKEMGGALLAAGLTGMFFAHYFVNIGMTIKVVPITGIPLPLTSYGGSFLVACMAGLGILQSVWIHRRDY